LALLGWAAMPGHVPGAVSVSLSCDDDARSAMASGGLRGRANEAVARGARQRSRCAGLVAQLVRAHA